MKYILHIILFCSIFSFISLAQTQQGYVKTRGKMVNGLHVQGQRLDSTLITLGSGRSLLSQKNGKFSFVETSKKYSLVKASKAGYVLSDPDIVNRTFNVSEQDTFIVVMEDEKQRKAELAQAKHKATANLTKEIRKREDEIESLREHNKITQEKYDSLILNLREYRNDSETLIEQMALRYISVDYDQLNDFNKQIQECIENGELKRADSLLQSKGSFEERISHIKAETEAINLAETKINQQQEKINKGKLVIEKDKEELKEDLYRKYSIYFSTPEKRDSALYYLKLRADIDTTDYSAIMTYATMCSFQEDKYEESESYAEMCLRQLQNERENLYTLNLKSKAYRLIGNLNYWIKGTNFNKGRSFYNNAILIDINILNFYLDCFSHQDGRLDEYDFLHEQITDSYNNVIESYFTIDRDSAVFYIDSKIQFLINCYWAEDNRNIYNDIAELNDLANWGINTYFDSRKDNNMFDYYLDYKLKALEHFEQLFEDNVISEDDFDDYNQHIMNLATFCIDGGIAGREAKTKEIARLEKIFDKAIKIYESYEYVNNMIKHKDNHVLIYYLCSLYQLRGELYCKENKYEEALEMYNIIINLNTNAFESPLLGFPSPIFYQDTEEHNKSTLKAQLGKKGLIK